MPRPSPLPADPVPPARRQAPWLPLALLAALAAGCTSRVRAPDLAGIYDRAAQDHVSPRNPVVVLPGVLGSRLRDGASGQVVWGAFGGEYASPYTDEGARLVALSMAEGVPLRDLRDGVVPDGALDRLELRLFGVLPIGVSAYAQLLASLGVGGYRDESLGLSGAVDYGTDHYTCFQFDYDWRRDLVESARELHGFLLAKREQVLEEARARGDTPDADLRFDLVAHSMGSLVTLYYLRYGPTDLPDEGPLPEPTWAGTELVARAVLVAPPLSGSLEALFQLVEGVRFGPFTPRYDAALLGTMPAVYQLLPRDRHGPLVDAADPERRVGGLHDPELWERLGWGLADPDSDEVLQQLLPDVPDAATRRRIALDHQRKCLERARRFSEALDRPAAPPTGLQLYLVAGDAEPTPAVAAVDSGDGALEVVGRAPGDGRVLRSSALADERQGGDWTSRLVSPHRWSQVMFLFTDHLGLTRDPGFTDNVLYLLLEAPD